jgi:hypothetical protein
MHVCTYQEPCEVYLPIYLHIPPPTPKIARHMCTYQGHISSVVLVSHAYVHISRALSGIYTKVSTHTPTYAADSKVHVQISRAYLIRRVGISCICTHIKSLVRYIYQNIYTYPHQRSRKQGICAHMKGISNS